MAQYRSYRYILCHIYFKLYLKTCTHLYSAVKQGETSIKHAWIIGTEVILHKRTAASPNKQVPAPTVILLPTPE